MSQDLPAGPAAASSGASPDLASLRAELDRIDNAIHDLLMQRAGVVEHVARAGKRSAFRPGREASIIRRLLGRHRGSLPPSTIVRMWREMLAGTTGMQTPVIVAVHEPDRSGAMTRLAWEHFGMLTPAHGHARAEDALAAVRAGAATVAVLPYPSAAEPWWPGLLAPGPRLHVIARLPFWQASRGDAPATAVVVATEPPDASGADRSILVGPSGAADRIAAALAAIGHAVVSTHPAGDDQVIEVIGLVAPDDARFGADPTLSRVTILGGYADPVEGGTR